MTGKNKLWTGDLVLILAVALLAFVGCQGLNNGTPIYVSLLGGTNAYAGTLILEFSMAAALSRLIIGRTLDRRSRRSFIIGGAVLMLVGTAGAIPFPTLEAQAVFRAIQGAGFGAITTAASTATADVAPRSRLGEALGYYGLGQSLGFAIGPSLAIVLLSFAWHEALFAGIAAVSLCLIVLGFACSYEKHPERLDPTSAYAVSVFCKQAGDSPSRNDGNASARKPEAHSGEGEAPRESSSRSTGQTRRSGSAEGQRFAGESAREGEGTPEAQRPLIWQLFEKDAFPGAIPMLVSCLGYAIIVSFVSKYGVQQGLAAPGMFFVCAAVTMTAIRLGGGRLIDRMRPLPLLVVPIVCGIACFALLALTSSELLFYVAGGLFGLSMGLAFPLFNTVCVKCAPTERRGAASALYGLANDMGIGLGSVAWGAVIDVVGYTAAFWGGAVVLVATFAVAAVLFPR